MSNIVSVHSFRGGTGKSNITANVSAHMARQGYRVGVIDTDMPSPGIHTLFGINDEHMGKALNDFLWGRCDIEQVAYNVSASLGQIIILRLDHQDFQGTAVTIDVARKLNVPDMVLVVSKVPFSYYDFVGELRRPPLTQITDHWRHMITITEAKRHYKEADAVHDFDHVLRVLAMAERIGQAEGADLGIVRAAALLHDVGREEAEAEGLDHAALAAQRTREILDGLPPARIEAVAHAVAAHRFRTDPQPASLEAQVLFDADKLDAIGAVGVARAFAYGGAHGQRLWAPIDSVDMARWLEEGDHPHEHTPVHEFVVKLSRLKERLFTPTGRSIAKDRHEYMVGFYERFDAEVRGER